MSSGVLLLEELMKKHGIDATAVPHSFVVSADGAAFLMREIFANGIRFRHVHISQEEDILFYYRHIAVRLRFESQPDTCVIMRTADVPMRTCCDKTSVASVMAALTVARA